MHPKLTPTAPPSTPACSLSDAETAAYYEECRANLTAVDDALVDLFAGRAHPSPAFTEHLFWTFNSLKVISNYLRDDNLRQLSQASERVMGNISQAILEWSPATVDALQSAVDRMQEITAAHAPQMLVDCSLELGRLLALAPWEDGAAAAAVPTAAAQPVPLETPAPAPSLKILLVEDDFTSRLVLQGLLSAHGTCHIAVNGREAVEAFRQACQTSEPYQLICMDIRMPEMDGTQAVKEIRAIEDAAQVFPSSGVKIMMTTGAQDFKSVSSSFKAQCDAYLVKPIDGTKLVDRLRALGLIG